MKKTFNTVPMFAVALIASCSLSACNFGFATVEVGNVGVVETFGAVDKQILSAGMHAPMNPLSNVHQFSTKLKAYHCDTPASSKDLQTVKTEVTVQYSISGNSAADILKNIGNQTFGSDVNPIEDTVLRPAVLESVKAVTAKFTAEELVTNRESVKAHIAESIQQFVDSTLAEKGTPKGLELANIAITNFSFSDEFNQAIEAKVKAEQEALQAKNQKTKRITEAEAANQEQKLKAEAEAFKIEAESKARADAIRREADALRLNPALIKMRAVEKWDGKLPVYSGGQQPIPFMNIDQLKSPAPAQQ